MRIPRKKELLELQKKYRSDRKIGDVYGVPARLVAYWRKKKNIGSYSFPKYSEEKIHDLWARFGDDARAGAELGISKAAFRQWRRRYNINQKPRPIRLEQLELPLSDLTRRRTSKKETMVQKILAKKSSLKRVEVGQIVNAEPDFVLVRDDADTVIAQFCKMGASRVWNPSKIAIILGNYAANGSRQLAISHRAAREFTREQKIGNFYDIGEGVCHQVALENGHILPGQLVFGTDLHVSSHGCIGVLATEVNAEEMAAVWAIGRLWIRVPATLKVVVEGQLARGVYAKDVVLKMMRSLSPEMLNYKAIEFHGSAISSMSISDRFTMADFALRLGAKSAMVAFDDVTARFLRKVSKSKLTPVSADPDAVYADEIEVQVSYLTPQVACPHPRAGIRPIEEVAGKKIDYVVLGDCVNSRIEDLEIAAKVLRGRRINRHVRMIVIPGTRKVMSEALDRGFLKAFVGSGCIVAGPGWNPCLCSHDDFLAPGERAISTGHPGCMLPGRSHDAEVYTASPATVAASALEGAIADPRRYMK